MSYSASYDASRLNLTARLAKEETSETLESRAQNMAGILPESKRGARIGVDRRSPKISNLKFEI